MSEPVLVSCRITAGVLVPTGLAPRDMDNAQLLEIGRRTKGMSLPTRIEWARRINAHIRTDSRTFETWPWRAPTIGGWLRMALWLIDHPGVAWAGRSMVATLACVETTTAP